MMRATFLALLLALGFAPGAHAWLAQATAVAAAYTGPGDVVAGAVAFWGLRAYSAATAGGSAVDVNCNGSTGTTYTIHTLANGNLDIATLNADCTSGTIFISKLYDQTGNSNDVIQATNAAQPTLTKNCIGALPCITNSATTFLKLASLTQAQPFTFATVTQRNAAFTTAQYMITSGSDVVNLLYTSSANTVDFDSGTGHTATAADSTWHTYSAISNGASGAFYIDGATAGTQNFGANTLSGALWFLTDAFSEELQGLATEGGIWPSAFTGGNSTSMNTNQKTYWGF